jgi:uncharacterized repeat protein (TIGR01451 family)
VVVEDTLPSTGTFLGASGGGVAANGVVRWPAIASLAAGATQGYSVSFRAPASGTLLNVVASTSATPDPDPASNDGSAPGARVTTTIDPLADVQVAKSGPASIATTDTLVTYSIAVHNAGPGPAALVVVTDTLPPGAVLLAVSNGGVVSNGVVTWPAIAQLPPGASTAFTLSIQAPSGNTFTNVAAVTSPTPDPALGNNRSALSTARTPTGISDQADVAVAKTGPATVAAGGAITYTITVRNLGPDAAMGVLVVDTLPAGAAFVSASGGGTAAGGVVTWPAIPTLANAECYVTPILWPDFNRDELKIALHDYNQRERRYGLVIPCKDD